MTRISTDILISGGGVAGLSAAAAFGSAGFSVICADPTPPVTNATDEGADLRTTAFLHPSIPVLESAGLWARLEPFAAPLQIMRIVDAGGETPEPRVIKDFDAADISDAPFGWNLPNWLLRREMVARRAAMPSARHAALSAEIVGHLLSALPTPRIAAFCWPIKHVTWFAPKPWPWLGPALASCSPCRWCWRRRWRPGWACLVCLS